VEPVQCPRGSRQRSIMLQLHRITGTSDLCSPPLFPKGPTMPPQNPMRGILAHWRAVAASEIPVLDAGQGGACPKIAISSHQREQKPSRAAHRFRHFYLQNPSSNYDPYAFYLPTLCLLKSDCTVS
jgi:hypothetical protein